MTFLVFLTCYSMLFYNLTSLITISIAFYSENTTFVSRARTVSHGLSRKGLTGSHGFSRALDASMQTTESIRELRKSQSLPNVPDGLQGPLHCLPCRSRQPANYHPASQQRVHNHQPAVTGQRSAACGHQPAMFVDLKRGPAAGGRRPLNIHTYIHIYINT